MPYNTVVLGDLMDEVVVVGGLAPSLLIDQGKLDAFEGRHRGSPTLSDSAVST